MRVLVATNHFAKFCGSEVVALEVARWFRERGDEVTLAANHIGDPIRAHADGVSLTDALETLNLSDFDFVWCQHDLLTLLPAESFARAAQERLPYIALISLSPYEPYEHVDATLARALSAEVLVNSPETASEIARRSHGQFAPSDLRVFHNAAPQDFWRASEPSGMSPELAFATLISNHAPPELLEALALLNRKGVRTRHIGEGRDYRLVRPEDVAASDAIIAIGKSVPYAVAQRKPVYMYDHFGGDGWLTRSNFVAGAGHNFSGRPARRRLDARSIVRELVSGYSDAAAEMDALWRQYDLRLFSLDHHLSGLRDRALGQDGDSRRSTLHQHLQDPRFMALLETLRAKSTTMKRNYDMIMQLVK